MKSMNQNFSPQPQVNAVGVAGAVISGVGLAIFLCVWVLASTISSGSNDFIGRAFTEIGGGFIVIGAGTVGALLSIVGIIVSARADPSPKRLGEDRTNARRIAGRFNSAALCVITTQLPFIQRLRKPEDA